MNKNGVQNSSMLYRVMHYKTQGMPIMVYLALAIPVIIGMVSGSLGTDLLSTIGMLFVIGVFFMELGRRLPIWNTWIGGAGMMAIMAPSFMVYMKWLPEKYVGSAKMLFTEFNFL
ncbi:MAG: 2-hydroxycarboxylate transporter family protein, partial [Oscillospiraceae bacterium]